MKRTLAKRVLTVVLALVLVLALGVPALGARTVLSSQNLVVNGEAVEVEKYNIDDYNYFKLRDLAELLNGTESQFDVDFDETKREAYITTGVPYAHKNGTELKTGVDNSASAVPTAWKVFIDGEAADLTGYNIGGNNFFQLRELGKAVHFYVHYDEATRTMKVDEQDEEEDWETGDASLDNPRNQDGIGKNEILVVSFGTSFNDSRVATIGAIENDLEKAFPGFSVRRGFTADTIIRHVYNRDDERIDNLTEALQRAADNGVKNLIIQPTHLMNGFEYDDIVAEVAKFSDSFDVIGMGKQLLDSDEDFTIVRDTVVDLMKEYNDGKTAIVFMGHGTEHDSNHVYADLQAMMPENYFIGTVEAEPSVEDVLALVQAGSYERVILRPLMIVAGDHANNDMAAEDDPESWYSIFTAAGYKVECVLEGLGQVEAIRDLIVAHARDTMVEYLEENFETGDASLDNPRNQDDIGENEILVVSFGTSFNDSRVATIGAIENDLEKAFPEYSVRRGFTADIIIDHVYRRDGEKIDNITEALERAVKNGVKNIIIQPTHLMAGFEYDDVVAEIAKYSDSFEITMGKQLLSSDADFTVVRDTVVDLMKEYNDGKTAIVFMGHGTEHASNHVYADLQAMMPENYFIGTVEAEPSVEDVLALVQAGSYERVILRPLMIVAGDHANNDMAAEDDPESWYSIFTAAGYKVECVLEGLGQVEAIRDLIVAHCRETIASAAPATAWPTRDVASKTAARTDVVEEGMAPVSGDKLADGTYTVKVKVSSTMFPAAENAVLTVKDGKMTAVITMGGEAQNWLFMGAADELAAADNSEFIPLLKADDGSNTFTLPVEALDAEILCCSYSKNRDAWYERSILFRADSLPEAAFTEILGTDPASLGLKDGEYTVEVKLAGGSGKTSVTSPAKLTVKDGKLTATIVFSSSKYDWVKLSDAQYDAVTTDPGSTFELPVSKLDSNIAIIGHTTAMGGQEISYTLNFDSATIK